MHFLRIQYYFNHHKVYFSGEEDRHEYRVGILVHKDMMSAVLGCRPVSSRLTSIRSRTAPFNFTIIQVYAPTSGHDDHGVDNLNQQLQEIMDQRHSGSTRKLECYSWKGCTDRQGRCMKTLCKEIVALDQQNRALEAATVTLRYSTALCPPMGKTREIFDLHFLAKPGFF